MPRAVVNETSPTATTYEAGHSVSATTSLVIDTPIGIDTQRHRKRDIEAAVYSYIQAMRTLGNTRVNSGDIAKALRLTVANVNAVLPKLNEKGVKRVG